MSARDKEKQAAEAIKQFKEKNGADDVYISSIDQSFIAISFSRQQIVLGRDVYESVYSFSQVVAVEVVANKSTITQTNRSSQLLGTVVGAAASGGLGALIGGLSGSTRSKVRLSSLVLKVIADDTQNPVHLVTFFKSKVAVDLTQAAGPLQRIDRMHAHCLVALSKAQAQMTSFSPWTYTDLPLTREPDLGRLEKLWDLKTKGLLSEEEYVTEKQRILNSNLG